MFNASRCPERKTLSTRVARKPCHDLTERGPQKAVLRCAVLSKTSADVQMKMVKMEAGKKKTQVNRSPGFHLGGIGEIRTLDKALHPILP